ncbi:MAG TPA: hypothetical protein VMO17_20920, partial [Terriglobia bacterium]|nr:hypothetical protein [Terriglobia bacterium]
MRWCQLCLTLLCLAPDLTISAQARSARCQLDIPVNVITLNGSLTQGLQQSSFVLAKAKDISLGEVAYDTTPRRVVFILDRESEMPKLAQDVAYAVMERILRGSRSGDSFSFISAEKDPVRVPFDRPSEVMARIQAVQSGPPPKSRTW